MSLTDTIWSTADRIAAKIGTAMLDSNPTIAHMERVIHSEPWRSDVYSTLRFVRRHLISVSSIPLVIGISFQFLPILLAIPLVVIANRRVRERAPDHAVTEADYMLAFARKQLSPFLPGPDVARQVRVVGYSLVSANVSMTAFISAICYLVENAAFREGLGVLFVLLTTIFTVLWATYSSMRGCNIHALMTKGIIIPPPSPPPVAIELAVIYWPLAIAYVVLPKAIRQHVPIMLVLALVAFLLFGHALLISTLPSTPQPIHFILAGLISLLTMLFILLMAWLPWSYALQRTMRAYIDSPAATTTTERVSTPAR